MAPAGRWLHPEGLEDPSNRFQLGERLAEGTYGEIFLATDIQSGNRVAIKVVENTEENFPDIEEEYRILKDLSGHPNMPKLHGVFLKRTDSGTEHVWTVMEYCSGGAATALVQTMKKRGLRMQEAHIAYILHETIQAACHLHRNHVIHRDIKGPNVLLTSAGDVKLVDFGISRHLKSTMSRMGTAIGTPYWMAPEVILCDQLPGSEYDIRADVWSLGITAIELGDGLPPLSDIHPVRAMFQVTRNPPPTLVRPSDWSQNYIDFIAECLEKNFENRPLMEEMAEHPFLSEVDMAGAKAELASLVGQYATSLGPSAAQATSKAGFLRTRPQAKALEILPDDLASLEDSSEDAVLTLLEKRFNRGSIYTFIADTLVAVNPFALTGLYNTKMQEPYRARARSDNAPHIFAVVDRAHQDMQHHCKPQSIVLSGETGAGKTFNARMALQHLCFLGTSDGKSNLLTEKVMAALSVVDLLGSASSSDNPSSTRMVRYLETTFTKTGRISGLIIWAYMLERWRVTDVRPKDGTFNALYAYYYGLKQTGSLGVYKLQKEKDLRYLPQHRHINPTESAEKFKELERNLELLEISKDKLETVRKAMAAILLMGEVRFGDDGEGATIENSDTVGTVSYLLSVDEEKLSWALQNRCTIVDGDPVKERKTVEDAEMGRDALARLLYGRVVDSVVNWTNATFTLTRLLFGEVSSVGVLDMCGFESRSNNYLEQLIVNSFNEQIQSFYNQYMFSWEMEDFRADDLEVPAFQFQDNSATIDMLMKKDSGLMSALDNTTLSDDPTDDRFLENCRESVESHHYIPERNGFGVAHFAGKVSYSCKDIVKKNREYLDPEVYDTLRQSENPCLAPMFLLPLTKTGNLTMDAEQAQRDAGKQSRQLQPNTGNKRFDTRSRGRLSQTGLALLTQATCYRYAAMEVMHKLINSTAHFVRCVRPNGDGAAERWETGLVANQLKCMQVVNSITIRRDGFSQRIKFAEFLRRYQFLAFDFDETVEVSKDSCRLLLVRLKIDGYAIGREKIFLKYYNEEFMSRLYEREVKKIAKIQAMIRAYLVRKRRQGGRPGGTGGAGGTRRLGRESAATLIQRYFRRWRGKTLFQQLQQYRAAKQHELVTFSHQVHIYAQEYFQHQSRRRDPVPAGSVVCEDREQVRQRLQAQRERLAAVRKLPLSLSLHSFVDTREMCEPHQPAPLQQGGAGSYGGSASPHYREGHSSAVRHSPGHVSPRASPGYRSPGYPSQLEVQRHSTTPVSETRVMFDRHHGGRQHYNAPVSGRSYKTSPQRAGSPGGAPPAAYPAAPPAACPPAPVYNRFAGTSYSRAGATSAGVGGGAGQQWKGTASTSASPFVQELQQRAARGDDNDDDDSAPPFNFQAMLKKTNITRGSMKRQDIGHQNLPANVVISSYGKPSVYNSKKTNTTEKEKPSSYSANRNARNASNGRVNSRGSEEEEDMSPHIVFDGDAVDL